jgi:hypothetical protein
MHKAPSLQIAAKSKQESHKTKKGNVRRYTQFIPVLGIVMIMTIDASTLYRPYNHKQKIEAGEYNKGQIELPTRT